MPRKPKPNTNDLDDKVIACFIDDHGNEVTTQEDRRKVLEHWKHGDYEFHRAMAAEKKILAIALLVACLMDDNDPVVMKSATEPYPTMECAVRILEVMYKTGDMIAIPAGMFQVSV